MKKQKGFSAVILLVIIASLSLIVASGSIVYSTQQKNNSNRDEPNKTENKETKEEFQERIIEAGKSMFTIRYINPSNPEEGITLYTVEDLSKLPDDFPAGAIELMKKDIGKQYVPNDPTSCYQAYSISKYNDVNVGGGRFSVDASKEVCPGGAMAVLSLGDNGEWLINGFQSVPLCSLIEEAQIYKEFVAQCAQQQPNSTTYEEDIIDNPNGNIADF